MQESNSENFNHLKIHSQFSICEGAIKIDDLKDISKDKKLKANILFKINLLLFNIKWKLYIGRQLKLQ